MKPIPQIEIKNGPEPRGSVEYRKWRAKVLLRDNFTCQDCGSEKSIEAHHIKSFRDFPDLRCDISNGKALCRGCHSKIAKPKKSPVKTIERTYISTFTYRGQDIDVLYVKGNISYVFELKGKRYGNAVRCDGKSIRDIMNATAALIIHFIEQYEAVV